MVETWTPIGYRRRLSRLVWSSAKLPRYDVIDEFCVARA